MTAQTIVPTAEQYTILPSEQIEVGRKGRPFRTLHQDGTFQSIGQVQLSDYEGRAQTVTLKSHNGKDYSLGRASSKYQVLDHQDVLAPLMDQGFEINRVDNTRGGARLFTVLTHPNITIDDFSIPYDNAHYGLVQSSLNLSVGIWSDARIGHGIRFVMGFWRSICSNGMVATILGLGEAKFSMLPGVSQKMLGWTQERMQPKALTTTATRPEALNWAIRTLEAARDNHDSLTALPDLIRIEATAFVEELSQAALQSTITDLRELQGAGQEVSRLDLVNVLTNVANRNTRATSRIYHALNPLAANLNKMVEVGALVSGTSFRQIELN